MTTLTLKSWLLMLLCAFSFAAVPTVVSAQDEDPEEDELPPVDEQQLRLIKQGKTVFEAYQKQFPGKKIQLAGAELPGVNLAGFNLEGADLRETDLRGTNFVGAKLKGADFRGADIGEYNLQVADFTGADMQGIDLTEADLTGAKLVKVNLKGAKMVTTHITGANLRDSDLTGADLTECDFEGVEMERTIMINTNFKDAENTDEAVMKDVFFTQKEVDDYKAKAATRPRTEQW